MSDPQDMEALAPAGEAGAAPDGAPPPADASSAPAPEGEAGLPGEEALRELRVRLPVFEGPLDLLLYLIKKEEVDVYDVHLERITKQYHEYIRLMRMLDLEIAGEFLVVAATLIYIKSRMLLPKDQQPPEEEAEEDDPRWELIRQLVEYKKFKDAAWQLHLRHLEQGRHYVRGGPGFLPEDAPLPTAPPAGEVGLFDLISAFKKVLDRANKREDLREIFEERFTVGDKINTIQQIMSVRSRIFFEDLFEGAVSRTEVVVTFLALLELIRMKKLRVAQPNAFGEIEIYSFDGDLGVIEPPVGAAEEGEGRGGEEGPVEKPALESAEAELDAGASGSVDGPEPAGGPEEPPEETPEEHAPGEQDSDAQPHWRGHGAAD